MQANEMTDRDLIAWIKASADYKNFVKPYFDTQEKFTILIVDDQKNLGTDRPDIASEDSMVSHASFYPHKVHHALGPELLY